MSRKMIDRSVKPCLEALEGRDLPSFLLPGVVTALAKPLDNLSQDLTKAQNDLKAQIQVLNNPGATTSQMGAAFGRAASDWQRMQADQHAIDTISNREMSLLKGVAVFEAMHGNTLDLYLLMQGNAFGMNPAAPITGAAANADAAVNDASLMAEITAPITFGSISFGTIKDAAPSSL